MPDYGQPIENDLNFKPIVDFFKEEKEPKWHDNLPDDHEVDGFTVADWKEFKRTPPSHRAEFPPEPGEGAKAGKNMPQDPDTIGAEQNWKFLKPESYKGSVENSLLKLMKGGDTQELNAMDNPPKENKESQALVADGDSKRPKSEVGTNEEMFKKAKDDPKTDATKTVTRTKKGGFVVIPIVKPETKEVKHGKGDFDFGDMSSILHSLSKLIKAEEGEQLPLPGMPEAKPSTPEVPDFANMSPEELRAHKAARIKQIIDGLEEKYPNRGQNLKAIEASVLDFMKESYPDSDMDDESWEEVTRRMRANQALEDEYGNEHSSGAFHQPHERPRQEDDLPFSRRGDIHAEAQKLPPTSLSGVPDKFTHEGMSAEPHSWEGTGTSTRQWINDPRRNPEVPKVQPFSNSIEKSLLKLMKGEDLEKVKVPGVDTIRRFGTGLMPDEGRDKYLNEHRGATPRYKAERVGRAIRNFPMRVADRSASELNPDVAEDAVRAGVTRPAGEFKEGVKEGLSVRHLGEADITPPIGEYEPPDISGHGVGQPTGIGQIGERLGYGAGMPARSKENVRRFFQPESEYTPPSKPGIGEPTVDHIPYEYQSPKEQNRLDLAHQSRIAGLRGQQENRRMAEDPSRQTRGVGPMELSRLEKSLLKLMKEDYDEEDETDAGYLPSRMKGDEQTYTRDEGPYLSRPGNRPKAFSVVDEGSHPTWSDQYGLPTTDMPAGREGFPETSGEPHADTLGKWPQLRVASKQRYTRRGDTGTERPASDYEQAPPVRLRRDDPPAGSGPEYMGQGHVKHSVEKSLLKLMKDGSLKPSEVGMTRKNATQDLEKVNTQHMQGNPASFNPVAPRTAPRAAEPSVSAEQLESQGTDAPNVGNMLQYQALQRTGGVADWLTGAGKGNPAETVSGSDIAGAGMKTAGAIAAAPIKIASKLNPFGSGGGNGSKPDTNQQYYSRDIDR